MWSLAAGLNLLSAREVRNGPIRRTHFDASAEGIQDDISRSTCGKKIFISHGTQSEPKLARPHAKHDPLGPSNIEH